MPINIYSDIDGFLDQQTDGDIKKNVDHEAVKNSLRNIVMTMKGTRRMLPDFGANIMYLLFEPMDNSTSKMIGTILFEEILKWETRINIINIDINMNYEYMQYEITLIYEIIGAGKQGIGEIDFILKQS